jgi:hypothetical protein
MIPTKEGYYWYKGVEEVDGRNHPTKYMDWDIVKVQLYSRGYDRRYTKHLKLKPPVLMFMVFSCWVKELFEVNKADGIWGKKICGLREY